MRVSLKIVGASGQGVNSIGAAIGKALKRSGYCVFGYREYPSLIKGGHASYQVDVSDARICSSETRVNFLIALDHHGLELNLREMKKDGVLVHVTPEWTFPERDEAMIRQHRLRLICYPSKEVLRRLGAPPILVNALLLGCAWACLGQAVETLKSAVAERFAHKEALQSLNNRCIEEGYSYMHQLKARNTIALPIPNRDFSQDLLLSGSEAMGLGAMHAGVRLYAGYPITPASPLMSYLERHANKSHMLVKQAEDEITAAQIVSGAMYMGARALTATSGPGFDLMTETVSLNGMIENPVVFVLAQRPGPATGLPTWTAQGDLLLAVNGSHGELPRCVLSVSDAQDAFELMPVAFNLAEQYQMPVIVLTEKQIAEALYTQHPYDLGKATIERGKLVTDREQLSALGASDRYRLSGDGVSPRWLPGCEAATFCAQADAHDPAGAVDEGADNSMLQMRKRMRKLETLRELLPQPAVRATSSFQLGAEEDVELLTISWGSTSAVIADLLRDQPFQSRKVVSLHYTYLWPLRTELLERLARKARQVVLVEQNYQGQLGMLIQMQCGLIIEKRILKYDGRPFFYDELHAQLLAVLQPDLEDRRCAAVPPDRPERAPKVS